MAGCQHFIPQFLAGRQNAHTLAAYEAREALNLLRSAYGEITAYRDLLERISHLNSFRELNDILVEVRLTLDRSAKSTEQAKEEMAKLQAEYLKSFT